MVIDLVRGYMSHIPLVACPNSLARGYATRGIYHKLEKKSKKKPLMGLPFNCGFVIYSPRTLPEGDKSHNHELRLDSPRP